MSIEVKTDPVLEAISRSLLSIETVPPMERRKMIKRAAKAGKKALGLPIDDIIKELESHKPQVCVGMYDSGRKAGLEDAIAVLNVYKEER